MGRAWSGDQPHGLACWERLHDIYQVLDARDRFCPAMLKQLGIEKGKPFSPDERLTKIFTDAAAAGELMAQANTFAKRFDGSLYRPDRQWDVAMDVAILLDTRPNAASVTMNCWDALPGSMRPSPSRRR